MPLQGPCSRNKGRPSDVLVSDLFFSRWLTRAVQSPSRAETMTPGSDLPDGVWWLREHQGVASRPWKNARHTLGTFYEERVHPANALAMAMRGHSACQTKRVPPGWQVFRHLWGMLRIRRGMRDEVTLHRAREGTLKRMG